MSLEQTIADLVAASNNLTDTINSKVNEIDQKVDQATADVKESIHKEMRREVFVDAVAGSDGNTGEYPGSAVKTIFAAANKIPSGGAGLIKLKRGQVHLADGGTSSKYGPSDLSEKNIKVTAYGNGNEYPILEMVPKVREGESVAQSILAYSDTKVTLRFEYITIRTGILTQSMIDNGITPYGGEQNIGYGGMISRGGGANETALVEAVFSNCTLHQQDFRLFTYNSSIANVVFYKTDIINESSLDGIFDRDYVKIIEMNKASFSGFDPSLTLDDILRLTAENSVSRGGSLAAN